MFFFITVLRALSALIITNSHYTGIYPTDLIANGGLLGDVIFFAVSGFCLYNVKLRFDKWYIKRILRVYPAVWIITLVYVVVGLYKIDNYPMGLVEWFIYPTNYHFVSSIIVLYIPFYIVAKVKAFNTNILKVMLGVFVTYLVVYIFAYDKSYYHIDTVREPMIRFLFFEAMLVGAYFKKNFESIKICFKQWHWGIAVIMFIIYFASKIAFSKYDALSEYQILNQICLIILLCCVFWCFAGCNNYLERIPLRIKRIILFVSDRTLEIYVVQYALIPLVREKVTGFPLNWLAVTASIALAAIALRFIVNIINKQTDRLFKK